MERARLYGRTISRMSSCQILTRLDRLVSLELLPKKLLRGKFSFENEEKFERSVDLPDECSGQGEVETGHGDVFGRFHSHWNRRGTPYGLVEPRDGRVVVDRARETCGRDVERVIEHADSLMKLVFPVSRHRSLEFRDRIEWPEVDSHGDANWQHYMHSNRYITPLTKAYLYTGREDYMKAAAEFITGWIGGNEVGSSEVAWNGMTTSQRIMQWLFYLPVAKTSHSWEERNFVPVITSMKGQIEFLARYLEKDQANNHLLFNLITLITFCVYWPEFRSSATQKRGALELLEREVERQVHEDGVSAEQSAHYHLIVLWGLLRLIRFLGTNNEPCPELILDRCRSMTDALIALRRPDGKLPMLADSESESELCGPDDVIALSAVIFDDPRYRGMCGNPGERVLWYLGAEGIERFDNMESRSFEKSTVSAFPKGGYFVVEKEGNGSGERDYLVFDCGPMGLHRNPAHGHSDALSFEWHSAGTPLVVDPGTYTYAGDPWRDYFRGTSAHNTICVDGENQSELWGASRVAGMANAVADKTVSVGDLVAVSGSHDGYLRLKKGPIRHWRMIACPERSRLVIWDVLEGDGFHTYDLLLHLADAEITRVGQTGFRASVQDAVMDVDLLHPDDTVMEIAFGEVSPPQGWISYWYGEKYPASVLRYSITGPAPMVFITCISSRKAHGTGHTVPRLFSLRGEGVEVPFDRAFGMVFDEDGEERSLMLSRGHPGTLEYGGIATDFGLLLLRKRIDGAFVISGKDGSYINCDGLDLLDRSRRYSLLDAVCRGGRLEVNQTEGVHHA